MEKWLNRASLLLLVVFGLLYIGAKIHFFTQYWKLGPGAYLEDHWFFWAAMAIVSGTLACVDWIRRRTTRRRSV